MRRTAAPVLLLGVAMAAACASRAPAGPDAATLTGLIAGARPGAAPQIRAVNCDFIEEEGSEWACRYRERAADGRWVALETWVAMDGAGWTLIDTPADPNEPAAD